MSKYDLDTAIANLPEESRELPVFILADGPFTNSPLFFYNKGEFYESDKYTIAREHIKSRGDGKPTKEEVDAVLPKFHDANKGILFNVVVTTHYGNWVVEGIKIISKKKADKELLQMSVDVCAELEQFSRFNSGYVRNPFR
jgi:hypothetical protein